jgi:predicted  nucleic acid-binding Zn-ribbon protein
LDSKGKPSVKSSLEFTGQTTEAMGINAATIQLAGWMRPSRFSDLKWFVTESAASRRQIILDLLFQGAGVTDDPLPEMLYSFASEGFEGDLDKLADAVDKAAKTAPAGTLLDRVRAIRMKMNEDITTYERDLESARAEIRGMIYDGTDIDPAMIPTKESELKDIESEVEDLHKRIGQIRGDLSRQTDLTKRIADLTQTEAEEKLKACGSIEFLRKEQNTIQQDRKEANIEIGRIDRWLAGNESELKSATATMNDISNRILAVQVGDHCILSASIPCPADRAAILDALSAEHTTAVEEYERIASEILRLRDQLKTYRDVLETADQKVKPIERRIEAAERAIGIAERRIKTETDLAKIVIAENVDNLETAYSSKRLNAGNVREWVTKAKMLETTATKRANLDVYAAKLELWIQIKKVILKSLKLAIARITVENIRPFVDKVNRILNAVLGREFYLSLEDARGNDDFEFGFMAGLINSECRPWDTASGGEQILVAAAMALVCMELDANSNVKVFLLDNVEQLFGPNRMALIRMLQLAIERGMIDNAVIAGCLAEPEAAIIEKEGIQWIQLEP